MTMAARIVRENVTSTRVPDSGREAGGRKEACFALGRGMQNGLTASPCTMND